VRIKMKGFALGPDLRLDADHEYDVPEELGRQLVTQHQATEIDDDQVVAETASAETSGETASLHSKKKRAN
jgi:hypothetical protein